MSVRELQIPCACCSCSSCSAGETLPVQGPCYTEKKTLSSARLHNLPPSSWIYNVGFAASHPSLLSGGEILICARIRSPERSFLKEPFPDGGKCSGPNIRTAEPDFNGIHDSHRAILIDCSPCFDLPTCILSTSHHRAPPPPLPTPHTHSLCMHSERSRRESGIAGSQHKCHGES